ncbi:MAG: hypothetical protein IJT25_00715 [Clostridia bacterium]|nr:hypothetical protein [Clostridia bacterium]
MEMQNNNKVLLSKKNRKKYLINIKKLQKNDKNGVFDNLSAVKAEDNKVVLEEFLNMKIWVKTLLSIFGSLPNIIKLIDSILSKNATNPFGTSMYDSTMNQIDKVINLYDRKNKMLNIYLLIKKIISDASEEDKKLISYKFVNKITIPAMAQKFNCTPRNVFRKINNLIDKLTASTIERGFTICFIESQLSSEPWIMEQYNSFKNEEIKKKLV